MNIMEGEITTEKIKEFIDKNSYPIVMEFDDRAITKIF